MDDADDQPAIPVEGMTISIRTRQDIVVVNPQRFMAAARRAYRQRMRCLAVRDPDLPSQLAEQLAADPEPEVRSSIAGHRNLPRRAQSMLLSDSNERVVHAAAASPSLPREEMHRMLALAGL